MVARLITWCPQGEVVRIHPPQPNKQEHAMRYFEINKWYRIPNGERLVLNTNYWTGRNRFVIRASIPVRPVIDPASEFVQRYPYPRCRSMICGSGDAWGKSSFYAVSFASAATVAVAALIALKRSLAVSPGSPLPRR